MKQERYRLTVEGTSIFGSFKDTITVWRKYPEGWGMRWGKKLKTPGRSFIRGATVDDVIKKIDGTTEYTERKITAIEAI